VHFVEPEAAAVAAVAEEGLDHCIRKRMSGRISR
jgi:hypothetical protein